MGTLNELADVISGYAFKSTWFGEGTAKVIRIGDLQNGIIEVENAATIDDSVNQIKPQFKIQRGDILMALSGATVGKIAVADEKAAGCYLNQRVAIIRSKKPESLDYLKYVFSGDYLSKLLMSAGGAAQPNLSPKDLSNMEIPLPPLAEQKRIAAILDKADAIRRKRQQAIQLADDFLRAVFLEMFGDPVTNPKGWEVMKFEAIGKLDRGKSKHRPRNDPKLLGGEHPLIQTGDVANSGGYIKVYSSTYSDFGLSQSRKWPAGTLCITIAANIAKTGILTFDACFPDSVVGFTPNKLVTTEYVQMWMSFLQKILENSAPESAQKNINLEILRELTIPVPPIERQNAFSSVVEKMNSAKETFDSGVLETNCFFSSLSQQAFSGQL
jgi:type I restriction enzyme S subunit